MQLTVTVVSPAAGRQANVVIDADPATAVARIAAELDSLKQNVALIGPGSRLLTDGLNEFIRLLRGHCS